MKSAYTRNDGADLYYEVRGKGAPLLMIHGGTGESGYFAETAEHLKDEYTVITYDRRNCTRSKADSSVDADVFQSASDAVAVLKAACGHEKAFAFGTSAGGIIALGLTQFYPGLFRKIVAHEAPVYKLSPDEPDFAMMKKVALDIMPNRGLEAAVEVFFPVIVPDPNPTAAPDPDLQARMNKNAEYFFLHELLPFVTYDFDLDKIAKNDVELIIVAGNEWDSSVTRSARLTAQRTGRQFIEVPGYHCFPNERPELFARTLKSILKRE
jgi:pimeloyl-ACP methyl ester carboxylesterase